MQALLAVDPGMPFSFFFPLVNVLPASPFPIGQLHLSLAHTPPPFPSSFPSSPPLLLLLVAPFAYLFSDILRIVLFLLIPSSYYPLILFFFFWFVATSVVLRHTRLSALLCLSSRLSLIDHLPRLLAQPLGFSSLRIETNHRPLSTL